MKSPVIPYSRESEIEEESPQAVIEESINIEEYEDKKSFADRRQSKFDNDYNDFQNFEYAENITCEIVDMPEKKQKVEPSEFKPIAVIGKGSFGEVYLVETKS